MPDLHLIMNHRISDVQVEDVRRSLGVERIVEMPEHFAALWSQIPPDLPAIGPFLEPLRVWLQGNAAPGDHVLIQGDFGACYLMVNFANERDLVPVYSSTAREAGRWRATIRMDPWSLLTDSGTGSSGGTEHSAAACLHGEVTRVRGGMKPSSHLLRTLSKNTQYVEQKVKS